MKRQPKSLSKPAQAIFELLVEGLEVGHSRRIDRDPGVFLPVSVERLSEKTFSVSHYYLQNGDLVPDPDMEFWRSADGRIFPTQFQNALTFVRSIDFEDSGAYRGRLCAQHDQAHFASQWMLNIRDQQGIRKGMTLVESQEAA